MATSISSTYFRKNKLIILNFEDNYRKFKIHIRVESVDTSTPKNSTVKVEKIEAFTRSSSYRRLQNLLLRGSFKNSGNKYLYMRLEAYTLPQVNTWYDVTSRFQTMRNPGTFMETNTTMEISLMSVYESYGITLNHRITIGGTIYFNGSEVADIYLNGTKVDNDLYLNDTLVG